MSVHAHHRRRSAFTLLELILSMTVLTAIVAILVQVMSNVQRVWRGGADDAATARIAFLALDRIAADLAATAQGPLPFEPGATNSCASILVIATNMTAAPLPPQKFADDLGGEGGSGTPFSRIAVLCDASRSVWSSKEDISLRPLLRTPRSSPELLRGLLRVRYDVVAREDSAAEASKGDNSQPQLCHDLVRSVAGLRVSNDEDSAEDGDDAWWKVVETPKEFGASEVLARNVVWFGVTVPDFLGVTTNRTGTANTDFQVFGEYSTVKGAPQPLPPLVDVVLGLVSDRTLSRAEAEKQTNEERSKAILREGLRVYTRRVQLR